MLRRPFSTEVLQLLEAMDSAGQTIRAGAWLWYPSMAGAIREPSFPALGQRLGLMRYWKVTYTKPDVCPQRTAPPLCRMI